MLDLSARSTPEDRGVRVFKLARSSFRDWPCPGPDAPEACTEVLALLTDPLVDGWQRDGVIWEVAIKEGFSLSSRVRRVESCRSNMVYSVADPDKDQAFLVCLDDHLDPATPVALGLSQDDLFICRDSALTDELAANLALQCRLKTI